MTNDTDWLPDEAEINNVDALLTRLNSVTALIDKLRHDAQMANSTADDLIAERDMLRTELASIIDTKPLRLHNHPAMERRLNIQTPKGQPQP